MGTGQISTAGHGSVAASQDFEAAHRALKADSAVQFNLTRPDPPPQPPPWLKELLEWLGEVLKPVEKFFAWVGKLMTEAAAQAAAAVPAPLNVVLRVNGTEHRLKLDPRTQEVTVNGRRVDLTSFEYRILEYLIHRAGEVISKGELTERLYAQDFDRDSNTIEVFIGRLRRKLDPDDSIKPIETLRGRGYRFALQRESAA